MYSDPEPSGWEQTPTISPGVPATCANVPGLGTSCPEIIEPKRGSMAPSVSCRRSRASGRRREALGGTVTGVSHTTIPHFEHFLVAHILGFNLYVWYMYPSLSLKLIDFRAFCLFKLSRVVCNCSKSTDTHKAMLFLGSTV